MLARLDRLAAQPETSSLGQPDEAGARSIAPDFDAFVDLVQEEGVDAQAIEAFVEPRIRRLRKACSATRAWAWASEREDADKEEAAVWYERARRAVDPPRSAAVDDSDRKAG